MRIRVICGELYSFLNNYSLYQLFIHQIGHRNVISISMRQIEGLTGFHRMFIACPRTAGYSSHHIPKHRRTENLVYPRTSVTYHAETTVDSFADTHTSTIMQRHQTHAPGTISGKALHSHIGHHVAAVFYIGSFTEG